MQEQVWKPVFQYEGYYEVSDHGNVRGVDRAIQLPDEKIRKVKGRLIAPKRNADGYLFVSLSRNGVTNTRYIHRMVAVAFIPNPWQLPEANHLDGDKTNNVPANLQWVTHQDNVIHAYAYGLNRNMGGSHKMAVGVIDNILGREFETVKDWCAARGINYNTGRNLLNGLNKSKTIDLTGVVKISKTNE